ncbi:hypothetical protein SAMN02745133_01931 [Desulforamulus putei DSM 12395]|uniref:Uncharacterized protein n=1 Tax=Desulforamulus putei DSM 12395 TaxID=1121429 RepID=A0A1M4ZAD1_9FIRM|nr:hypothetical protein SAMN02745133_01931 [Desulforamulus putei DSM 12395]
MNKFTINLLTKIKPGSGGLTPTPRFLPMPKGQGYLRDRKEW